MTKNEVHWLTSFVFYILFFVFRLCDSVVVLIVHSSIPITFFVRCCVIGLEYVFKCAVCLEGKNVPIPNLSHVTLVSQAYLRYVFETLLSEPLLFLGQLCYTLTLYTCVRSTKGVYAGEFDKAVLEIYI